MMNGHFSLKNWIPTIIISVSLAIILFTYLFYSEEGTFPIVKRDYIIMSWTIVMVISVGIILHSFSNFLNKILPWRIRFGKRFFLGLLLYNIISIAIIFIFFIPYLNIFHSQLSIKEYYLGHTDLVFKIFILSFVVIFFYSLIDFALFSYHQYANEQIESIRLKREKLGLQYEALTNQLSPHFLFNSLNTISSLIHRNAGSAEKYIRKLALSYQHILSSIDKNIIPLWKELQILRSYHYLMEVRFANTFKLEINIPDIYNNNKIPVLSLQILVENALKHNTLSEEKPLDIKIYISDNKYLVVKNNITDNQNAHKSKKDIEKQRSRKKIKIGLNNIHNRYKFYTNRKVIIEMNKFFTVKLPLLSD